VRRSGLGGGLGAASAPPDKAGFLPPDGEQHLASLPPALDAELISLHPATGRRRLLGWPSASPWQRQPAIVLRPGAAPGAAMARRRSRATPVVTPIATQ